MNRSKNWPDTVPADYASDDVLADAYRRGWNHGHGVACHNVPKLGETYLTDAEGRITCDADNVRELHGILCHEAADNARCYSPFEFTASEFNAHGEFRRDEVWEAFEAGTSDAIAADMAEYTDADYGLDD
ncbi:MAG: hypothetical protein ABFD65_14080 [Candidatus Polarisedimenticolia bacterium]